MKLGADFGKRGQVAIFIIIAIIVVAGVVIYFTLKSPIVEDIPQNMRPIYDFYLSCLEDHARQGASLLGEQGGVIESPDFIPGSQYMPFSSQLDFFGQPVPYWMYISGNNILKEQLPSKLSMESQLAKYVEQRVDLCNFDDFELSGFGVVVEEGNVEVDINDLSINVQSNNVFKIYFENDSIVVSDHSVELDSKLGKFYGMALEVYEYEKTDMFLEKYALDVMRLYAPVTGVEISCSPKVFVDSEIRESIVNGLEANVGHMKLKGNYYDLSSKDNEYFVTDAGLNVDENVNFVYSRNWPTKIEIYGDRVVQPIGLQEGLGVLGFCYVNYHLVYDIAFPVMIQFYDLEEVFQFPVSVIIDKNNMRNALPTIEGVTLEDNVCKYKNQNVIVHTYDENLNGVEARVRFKCLNSECQVGETKARGSDSVLSAQMPRCVNGFLIASAEGYAESKYQISSNEENVANIILNTLHPLEIDVNSGDIDQALVSFESEDYSATAVWPDLKEVKLIEGYYNISVYVYRNSSLVLPASVRRECVNVPKEGIGGIVGLEEERCFDISLPEQEISFAVVGGGRTADYFISSDLAEAEKISVVAPMFDTPSSLEDVQRNYLLVEESNVEVELV
jgi:hypothetical protein